MPHGVTLLATPRNNDNCCLLFEQPSSGYFHATPWVSSYLCSLFDELLTSTTSTYCCFSPRSEGTNASSSSSSCLHSWYIPHNLHFVTKSLVWRLSSRILQALSYSSDHPKNSEDFYCRNGVLAMNNISTASAPHRRCQHPTMGALLLAQAKRTRNISSTSSYCHSSSPSHDLRSVTRPTPHKTVLENLTLASTEQVSLLLQMK